MNTIREAAEMALKFIDKVNMWGCLFAQFEDGMCATRAALRTALAEESKADPMSLEAWEPSDTAHRPGGLPQDFTKHEVESFDDWSGWVSPDPEQYFMKCCDCGLVHEMQFKVAKYSEGDKCEFVADADLQAVFRARRTTPPQRKPLTDEEIVKISDLRGGCYGTTDFARAIERAHGIGSEE
jgi:hypothetical protein